MGKWYLNFRTLIFFDKLCTGLPARYQTMVEDIWDGMPLFLYDTDSRRLWGVYMADGRGGMHLEAASFSRSFPAQVITDQQP